MKDLMFCKLFNSNLLFYSWNQLKNSDYFHKFFNYDVTYPSFSSFWFRKTAFLIKSGRYIYFKKTKLHCLRRSSKTILFGILAQMIVELSFINLISYCERRNLMLDLTRCVRDFEGKLTNFL